MADKKRRQFTLEQKVEIFKVVDSGRKKSLIAKDFDITPSTLSTFLKDRKKIEYQVEKSVIGPASKRIRTGTYEDVDEAVYAWFMDVRSQNIPLSGPLICQKARQLAAMLGVNDFQASTGWLCNFRKRRGIVFKQLNGEEASAPTDVIAAWRESAVQDELKKYSRADIFNCDETGLLFQLMPNRTMALKGDRCKGGKNSKQRITVLLCCNASGTEKLKPLVIGRSGKPRCFRNWNSRPCDYKFNKKAWMTAEIYCEWLLDLDKKMQRENRNVVLLMDNCSAHNKMPKLKNVKTIFFPPNCTSVLQPLDQGIIRSMKAHYRTRMMQRILINLARKESTTIDIRQAIEMCAGGWWNVSRSVIVNCWRKAGFLPDSEFESEEDNLKDVDDSSETVDDDENSRSLWVEISEKTDVPSEVDFEDFVHVDDDLMTARGLSDEEIIEAVNETNEEAEDVTSEEEETEEQEELPGEKKLTLTEAVKVAAQLHEFLSTQGNVPDCVLASIDNVQQYCITSIVAKKVVQRKMTDYFATPRPT